MKNKIFMYLFIMAVLFLLFQYTNSKKILEASNQRITVLEHTIKQQHDSIVSLNNDLIDQRYFSLEGNGDAIEYFPPNYEVSALIQAIEDTLYESNEADGDNPLIPYAGMQGAMKINKIKILNHKWLLADFSDGEYWGELFMNYRFEDDQTITFKVVDHLMYLKD